MISGLPFAQAGRDLFTLRTGDGYFAAEVMGGKMITAGIPPDFKGLGQVDHVRPVAADDIRVLDLPFDAFKGDPQKLLLKGIALLEEKPGIIILGCDIIQPVEV